MKNIALFTILFLFGCSSSTTVSPNEYGDAGNAGETFVGGSTGEIGGSTGDTGGTGGLSTGGTGGTIEPIGGNGGNGGSEPTLPTTSNVFNIPGCLLTKAGTPEEERNFYMGGRCDTVVSQTNVYYGLFCANEENYPAIDEQNKVFIEAKAGGWVTCNAFPREGINEDFDILYCCPIFLMEQYL